MLDRRHDLGGARQQRLRDRHAAAAALVRLALSVGALTLSVLLLPHLSASAAQRAADRLAGVNRWSAEVIVTSDCDRMASDGSRTIIHNRIATTYEFTRRLGDRATLTWSGRAATTYRWLVGVEFLGRREVEASSASFETDAKLELAGSVKISVGRVPPRPFARSRYFGDALLDTQTADGEPPAAELRDAPLPPVRGTMSGKRMEASYSLLGGMVLTCPAERQWTIRAA